MHTRSGEKIALLTQFETYIEELVRFYLGLGYNPRSFYKCFLGTKSAC